MKMIILLLFLLEVVLCSETSIVVYNQNFALVKETRKLKFRKGTGYYEINSLPGLVDSSSIRLSLADDKAGLKILEKNYEYDLITKDRLIREYVGKEIEVVNKGKVLKGVLLSSGRDIIVKVGKKIYINPDGEIVLPNWNKKLATKPHVKFLLESKVEGEHSVDLEYLTGGIKWTAGYILVIDRDDKMCSLDSFVDIVNESGKDYRNVRLKLIAGSLNRVSEIKRAKTIMAMREESAFKEEGFFEYHIYKFGRRVDLEDKQNKQISLVSVESMPFRKVFLYRNKDYGNRVKVIIEIENSKEYNLGLPLPKGKVKLYKYGEENNLIFIGEDIIKHTSKGEKIRIVVGDSFDLVAKRKKVSERFGDKWRKETYSISISNNKKEKVLIKVIEDFPYRSNWKILDASFKYKKEDANSVYFVVEIPSGEKANLSYTVKYWR